MRGSGFFNQRSEAGGIVYGDVGEDFAIQIDACLLEAVDELAVGDLQRAAGGIDAHNPKRAEIALLEAAADVAVTERFFDGFLRGAIQLRFGKKVAFRPAKCFVAVVPPMGTSFYSWHVFLLLLYGWESAGTCGALPLPRKIKERSQFAQ